MVWYTVKGIAWRSRASARAPLAAEERSAMARRRRTSSSCSSTASAMIRFGSEKAMVYHTNTNHHHHTRTGYAVSHEQLQHTRTHADTGGAQTQWYLPL